MTTIDKLEELCQKSGVAISRLEKDLGYGNASLAGLKKDIPFMRVVDIARYFNVPLDYFVPDSDVSIDEDEAYLISVVRSLNEEGKRHLRKQAQYISSDASYIKNSKHRMVQGE